MDLNRVSAGQVADIRFPHRHVYERIGLGPHEPHRELTGIGKVVDHRCRNRHRIARCYLAVAVVVGPAPVLEAHCGQGRRLNSGQRIDKPAPELPGITRVLRIHVVARQPNVLPQRVRRHFGKPRLHQGRHAGRQRRRERCAADKNIPVVGSGRQNVHARCKDVHQLPVVRKARPPARGLLRGAHRQHPRIAGRVVPKQVVVANGVTGRCHHERAHVRGQIQRLVKKRDSDIGAHQTAPARVDDVRPVGGSIEDARVV